MSKPLPNPGIEIVAISLYGPNSSRSFAWTTANTVSAPTTDHANTNRLFCFIAHASSAIQISSPRLVAVWIPRDTTADTTPATRASRRHSADRNFEAPPTPRAAVRVTAIVSKPQAGRDADLASRP